MVWLTGIPEFGSFTGPWSETDRFQREMDRFFLRRPVSYSREFPAINIWTSDGGAIATSEIPGVDEKNIDISVEGDVLTLSGSRSRDELVKGQTYHRQERPYGRFSRKIRLPFRIDSAKVEARYEKGVLIIRLPRAEEDKPRKIKIKAE
ncbi:MAG: Hsp20/alpha crystallin family protein [Deltaproteobacteria bacterium]|nr:Hsp20/alpha crystallin family protein [Deltaproteobacteria bacterium]